MQNTVKLLCVSVWFGLISEGATDVFVERRIIIATVQCYEFKAIA